VVYLLANAGYARALGLAGLQGSSTGANMAAANLFRAALGGRGARALSGVILLSCVGGCMSSLLTGSRVFVPLATDGLFPRALGAVSARTGVPWRAVLTAAVLGGGYVTVRSFEQLTDAFVAGMFPFYALAVAAVYVLRRRERALARPFRAPGYPVAPALFLLGAGALMAGAFAQADRTALYALGVVALGVALRGVATRLRRSTS
jgi:APA family basic amino acid/polyamine antiporter